MLEEELADCFIGDKDLIISSSPLVLFCLGLHLHTLSEQDLMTQPPKHSLYAFNPENLCTPQRIELVACIGHTAVWKLLRVAAVRCIVQSTPCLLFMLYVLPCVTIELQQHHLE